MQSAKQLNQFLTPDWLAQQCIEYTISYLKSESEESNISGGSCDSSLPWYWIDPCAGNGAFYNHLPINYRLGIEIDESFNNTEYLYKKPNGFLSVNQDDLHFIDNMSHNTSLLSTTPTKTKSPQRIIIIGNPPFTQRSTQFHQDGTTYMIGGRINLALQFLHHASTLADTIAFIVGKNARRPLFQKKIPKDFELVFEKDLPDVEFTIPLSSTNTIKTTKHIHTLFQIYRRKKTTLNDNNNNDNNDNRNSNNNTNNVLIRNGKWQNGDWDIVFPTDPKCNLIIKRWATKKIGDVSTDETQISAQRNKAIQKESSKHYSGNEKGRKRLGRTDSTWFFISTRISNHIVAKKFRQRKHLFLKLRQMASINSYSCNQQQLLDIYRM